MRRKLALAIYFAWLRDFGLFSRIRSMPEEQVQVNAYYPDGG